jgi:hypothetical protein
MTTRTVPLLVLLFAPLAAAGAFLAIACTHGADPALQLHGGAATGGRPGAGSTGGSAASLGGAGGTLEGFGGAGGGTDGIGGAPGLGGAGGGGSLGDDGGDGREEGGAAVGSGGATPATSSTASAAQSSSSSAGGTAACAIGHMLISEIRSRGAGGATDEFVALFNATGSAVTLDASWVLEVRGAADSGYRAHWTGTGTSVPAWGHFLIAGTGYSEAPAEDQALVSGIVDAASLRLVHAGTTVSAVCYAYSAATQAAFDATFTCAGTPVSNLPHDDVASAAGDVDTSIARRPGGAAGNCTDTGDNAADFVAESPATPESSASPPTP